MADNENEVLEPEDIDLSVTVDASQIDTIPVDTTLTHAGEAADAKATGDAIALKTSLAEVEDTLTVNGQGFDSTHNIELYATTIDMSAIDSTTIAEAIVDLEESVEVIGTKTADDIIYEDDASVKDVIDGLNTDVAELQTRTGSDIKLSGSVNTTLEEVYYTLVERVTGIDEKTAEDIKMTADEEDEATVSSEIARLDAKSGDDILLEEDGTDTIADAISDLRGDKVDYDDIIDDLSTQETEKALSANQGHVLNGLVTALQNSKLDKNIIITPDNLRSWESWVSGMTTLSLINALPAKCIFQTALLGTTPVELSDFTADMDKAGTLFVMKSSASYAACLMFPKKSSDAFWYFIMRAADDGHWYKFSPTESGLIKSVNGVAGDADGNVELGYISNEDIDALFAE